MELTDIQKNVAALNASVRKPVKKTATKKAAPSPTPVISMDESLRVQATRICAAFGMIAKGVTPEILVAGVKQYEETYRGTVQ